jgi:hypothetical protein
MKSKANRAADGRRYTPITASQKTAIQRNNVMLLDLRIQYHSNANGCFR